MRRQLELDRVRSEMEVVLWEVLEHTNTTKAQFSNMMNYIMRRFGHLRDQGFPRIAFGKKGDLEIKFDGYEVYVPFTEDGLAVLREVLAARHEGSTIGTRGSPTQWDIDNLVKEFKKKRASEPKPVPEVHIDLNDLGI